MARGCYPALVLHAGPARLISERNREREPSREEDRENWREGGWEEKGTDPAPAHCERSKCSFHLLRRLREKPREFERANRSSERQCESLIEKDPVREEQRPTVLAFICNC